MVHVPDTAPDLHPGQEVSVLRHWPLKIYRETGIGNGFIYSLESYVDWLRRSRVCIYTNTTVLENINLIEDEKHTAHP